MRDNSSRLIYLNMFRDEGIKTNKASFRPWFTLLQRIISTCNNSIVTQKKKPLFSTNLRVINARNEKVYFYYWWQFFHYCVLTSDTFATAHLFLLRFWILHFINHESVLRKLSIFITRAFRKARVFPTQKPSLLSHAHPFSIRMLRVKWVKFVLVNRRLCRVSHLDIKALKQVLLLFEWQRPLGFIFVCKGLSGADTGNEKNWRVLWPEAPARPIVMGRAGETPQVARTSERRVMGQRVQNPIYATL